VATTRSRPRGREHARPSTGGVVAEHSTKIYSIGISGIVVIVAFLALTSVGHVIDAATQHFMLYYAGVFALIALCASVGLGLIATDRLILNPGHRVLIQAAHRAASFGAVTFLIIHIVTEILAQRVHVLDAFVPFLSPFRTFYIGLGTIASDLIILLVITGIMRGRFTAHGKAWRWKAIHYTSYLSFVFGVWHGLLGGRPGKPYVDWSYGFLVALVLVGLAVRILSNSLKPKETVGGPPVPTSASSASAPMRAAAMFAQLSAARQARTGPMMVVPSSVVSGQVGGARSGPMPMLPAPVMEGPGAPGGPGYGGDGARQPFYEPGYEGPPRYLGAPSSPSRGPASGPLPRATTGPIPQATTGPMPRAGTGPLPRAASGPMPRAGTGPMPRAGTGPMPRAASGPMPRAGTGPMPRAGTGPMPYAASGPMPRAGSGPMPPHPSGPLPRAGSGPMPQHPSGPMPRAATGPMPQYPSGPMPRAATGPMPRAATGPMPPAASGPRPASGPMPYAAGGPRPGAPSGPLPRAGGGPRADRGRPPGRGRPQPDWSDGAYDRSYDQREPSYDARDRSYDARIPSFEARDQSYDPRDRSDQGYDRGGYEPGYGGYGGYDGSYAPYEPYDAGPPWEGGFPEPDPTLKFREPGPGMPGYRGSREHRYGGDRY
jgi:DMSO/TMAO reductase YedYZ heme-binding membrane subunit